MSNLREAAQQAPSIEAARSMGEKGGPAVEAERLAFEAWMAGHCWQVSQTWDGKQYGDRPEYRESKSLDPLAMHTRQLWAAWRDRAALAQPDDKAQPVTPDFADFVECEACCGKGFNDVVHQVAERKSDVQTFREECEFCAGHGKVYKGQPLYAAPQDKAQPVTPFDLHAFKNFHRALCERFDYVHDEKDWRRDQVSLIEHIAKLVTNQPSAQQPPADLDKFKGCYCSHCRRGVDSSEVTFHEQHMACGRVITNDRPPKPAEQGAELSDEQAELLIDSSDGRWVDGEFRIDGRDLMKLLRAARGGTA